LGRKRSLQVYVVLLLRWYTNARMARELSGSQQLFELATGEFQYAPVQHPQFPSFAEDEVCISTIRCGLPDVLSDSQSASMRVTPSSWSTAREPSTSDSLPSVAR
jgi:hypothetical protein